MNTTHVFWWKTNLKHFSRRMKPRGLCSNTSSKFTTAGKLIVMNAHGEYTERSKSRARARADKAASEKDE